MKQKKITFFVHDYEQNKLHLVQHSTIRRTVREAFGEAVVQRMAPSFRIDPDRAFRRFEMVGAVRGMVEWMKEDRPLREPTRDEITAIINENSETAEYARLIDSGLQVFAREEGHEP